MTKPGYTDITLLLDRSGSMASIGPQLIAGYQQFLAEQQTLGVPAEVTWSLLLFDHEYRVLDRAVPIAQAKPLTPRTFQPRGNTALWDAFGRAIQETGDRLFAIPEPERPSQVLLITISDGIENASQRYRPEQLQAMVDHQRLRYLWQFAFLGANQDLARETRQLGLRSTEIAPWTPTPDGVKEMFHKLSERTSQYRRSGQSPVPTFFPAFPGRFEAQRRGDAARLSALEFSSVNTPLRQYRPAA